MKMTAFNSNNTTVVLYHGSDRSIRIENINLEGVRRNYDFGQGFYLTENKDIAEEWAIRRNSSLAYVNEYALDLSKLSLLRLNEEEWLHVVLNNRYNLANVYISSDAVYGVIADDSLYETITDFRRGIITSGQVFRCMTLIDIGNQYCLKKNKGALSFICSYRIDVKEEALRRARRRKEQMDSKVIEIYREHSTRGLYYEDFLKKGDYHEKRI